MIGLDVFLPGLMSAAATSSKQRLGAMFVRSSAEHLAVKENIAKIAICYNIWEHVQNRMELLRQVSRVLCQDGLLLLVVPNRFWVIETHYRLPLLSWLPRSLANAYLRVTRRGTEYDVSCPSWWELKESLECGGFGVNNLNLFIIRNFNVLYPEPEYLGATKHRVGCLVSLLLNALPDRIAELISNLLTEAFFVTAEKLPSK